MQALYLADNKLSYQTKYDPPVPQAGEALIRLTLMGICSTDLELVKGYYPFDGVLGHEFVGVVEACADQSWVGQRVVGTINISPACKGACGLRCPEQCPDRTVLGIVNKDGVFADYVTLPIGNLLRVPSAVTDEQAVFTEPLAAAVRITEQCEVAGKSVAVIGPGRLGLLVAQVLRQAGGDVSVLGRSKTSLELPKDLGFKMFFSDSPSLPAFDLVVEATASPAGLQVAVDIIRPNHTLILKSTYAETAHLPSIAPLLATLVVNEITVIGSRCGPFAPALVLLQQGAIQTEPLIHGTYALKDGVAAFEHAAQAGVRKILLKP